MALHHHIAGMPVTVVTDKSIRQKRISMKTPFGIESGRDQGRGLAKKAGISITLINTGSRREQIGKIRIT